MKTWTITYYANLQTLSESINPSGFVRAAIISAEDKNHAIATFQTQYAGQFSTILGVSEF